MAAVSIRMIAAKRRDFDAVYQHHAELDAHQLSFRKQRQELIGTRVGRDIVVRRFPSQHQIAHAAAHQPRLEAAGAQPGGNLDRFGSAHRIIVG